MNKTNENENQKIKVVWESELIFINHHQSPGEIITNSRNQFIDPTVWRIRSSPIHFTGCSNGSINGRVVLLDAGPKVAAEVVKKLTAENNIRLGGLFELCHFVMFFKTDARFRKGEHFIVALNDSIGDNHYDRIFSSLLGNHLGYSIGVTYEHVLSKHQALFLGFKPETYN